MEDRDDRQGDEAGRRGSEKPRSDGSPGQPPPGGTSSNLQGDSPARGSTGTEPRDPVQESHGDSVDLYEIATWEPRTALDRTAVRIAGVSRTIRRTFLIVLAFVLFLGQMAIAGVLVFEEPILGLLALVSVLPALFLVGYLWYRDPTRREPLELLGATFLLAALFASFAALVNTSLLPLFEPIPAVGLPLFYFVVVGPIEEFVKWLAVRVRAYRSDSFRTVVDGVVYGAVAGLGFAAIENLYYIVFFSVTETPAGLVVEQQYAVEIATRRLLVGPGHVIFSAWAGFYLGLAKFNPTQRGPLVVKGLLVAAFIHAAYNTLVTVVPLPGLSFLVFLLVYHGFWFTLLYRKIAAYRKLHLREQEPRTDASDEGRPRR